MCARVSDSAESKGYKPGYNTYGRENVMMEEEKVKKEMYLVYAYVMELGNDFIPSDAASEGSLKWFCKIERIMAEDAVGA